MLVVPDTHNKFTVSFITLPTRKKKKEKKKGVVLSTANTGLTNIHSTQKTTIMSDSEGRSRKMQKTTATEGISDITNDHKSLPHTLARTISPPPLRRNWKPDPPEPHTAKVIKSPFQLTWIRDLPTSSNVDAVTLRDILGDPMIAECWEFNYLHDLDYLMEQFDSDVRDLIKVHVIHGFWKNEDQSRLRLKVGSFLCLFAILSIGYLSWDVIFVVRVSQLMLDQEQAIKYPNITLHAAYMPEMFGTHHTKVNIDFLLSRAWLTELDAHSHST